MSEQVDDVSISCDEDLTVECQHINTALQWNFQVETEVRFLQYGRELCYFSVKSQNVQLLNI